MLSSLDLRYTTGSLDALNVRPKQALAAARENERPPLGLIQMLVGLDTRFNAALPFLEGRLRWEIETICSPEDPRGLGHLTRFVAYEPQHGRGEGPADFREVNRLQSVAARPQR